MPSSLESAHCRPWWPSAVPHSTSEAIGRPTVDGQTAPDVEVQAAEASCHSSARVLYAGVFLSDASRQVLCNRVQPQHSNQSADHVTLVFRPASATVRQLPLGEVVSCLVTGVACSTELQAVAVQLPDSLSCFTPDAAHVTISVAEGRSNKDAGPFLQQAQASQGGGQYRPYALPWIVTGTVGVRLTDGRTVLSSQDLPNFSPHKDVATSARSSAAPGRQLEPSCTQQAAPGQPAAGQQASQAANIPPRAIYEGQPEGVEGLQVQQAVPQVLQLAPSLPSSAEAAHKSTFCTGSSPRPASAPLPIPTQGRAAHQASPALPALSPLQHGASQESSSSPVDSSDGSSPPQRPRMMAPAAPKQQDLGAPQKQLLPQLLASDMAGLSFGAKLAAAWSGQLQASALQGLHDQAASSPGLAPQRCNLLLPKHKPVRQQAAQQAPHKAHHKGVSHPSHTRKALLPAPPGATPPAQITHSFLEPSPSSQKVASNAASQAQLLPQSFPDLAWQSPPVGKAPASWVQGSASAMLSCSPEGPEQAQQQAQQGGLFHDSSNSSSSDEGLTPEAARASAERSVRRREHLHRMADIERKAADMHTANAAVFGRAAREAYDQGETLVAKELGGRSRDSYQLAQDARAAANAAALNACNHSISNRFKVDLHGMHVEEALTVLDRHLVNLGGLGSPSGILLQVVTGVGKHSQGGQPRILPAIVRVLMASGLRFNHEPGNAGVIEVHLPGVPLDDSLHPGHA